MYRLLVLLTLIFAPACGSGPPGKQEPSEISMEETLYLGRPHFLVRTNALDYYYDIRGGGFSRILDKEGNDWIGFRMEPWDSYPAAAASSFRGLPNLVFQQSDDGAGHPGHDKCISRAGKNRIITESLSGRWKWSWEFHNAHAILEMNKTDPERSYWFLYEGTPGGIFSPDETYFGNNMGGPHKAVQDYYQGDILWGDFRWIYAWSSNASATLFMIQEQEDELMDMISFLGNTQKGLESPDGMTVFGFGREKEATPLLKGGQRFIIGLYPEQILDQKAHQRLKDYLEMNLLNQKP